MPAKNKLVPAGIHLLEMKIIHGEMKSPGTFDPRSIAQYESEVQFDMAFNLEAKKIRVAFDVEIKTCSKAGTNQEEATGIFQFQYFFQVDNLSELAVQKGENIELHGGLGNALAAITYSTTRGILMTRFQGTALSDFILPIKDPNELLG